MDPVEKYIIKFPILQKW